MKEWDRPVAELSGGTRKRVAIARALLTRPDLLLLDEPTNHLDADTVDWLEEELDGLPGALLLVTHDRYFLDDLVDRIVEITPGAGVTSYPGNYEAYLEQKLEAEELAARRAAQARALDRPGGRLAPARRRGAAHEEQGPHRARAQAHGRAGLRPPEGGRAPDSRRRRGSRTSVIEAHGLAKAFDGRDGPRRASTSRSSAASASASSARTASGRPPSCGCSSASSPADAGEVVVGQADEGRLLRPAARAARPGADRVRGGRRRPPGRTARTSSSSAAGASRCATTSTTCSSRCRCSGMQVKALSGGERNRLLLAKLFLEGANVLVLDEPTNDLDLVTLERARAAAAPVRRQRCCSSRTTATSSTRWRRRSSRSRETAAWCATRGTTRRTGRSRSRRRRPPRRSAPRPPRRAPRRAPRRRRAAPSGGRSAAAQAGQAHLQGAARARGRSSPRSSRPRSGRRALEATLADPATYQKAGDTVAALRAELDGVSGEVERLYARWQELEGLREAKASGRE